MSVYIVYSSDTLQHLENLFKCYGNVGLLKVIKSFNKELNKKEETNRTLAIFSLETYQKMCGDGLDTSSNNLRERVKILPYKINDRDYPKHDTRDLFVPVPTDYSEDCVRQALNEKLEHLASWNIIPDKSWILDLIVSSRQEGTISGCVIKFSSDVGIDQIALTRVLIDDTFWPERENSTETAVLSCRWGRVTRPARTNNPGVNNSEISNSKVNSSGSVNSDNRNNKPKKLYVPKKFH